MGLRYKLAAGLLLFSVVCSFGLKAQTAEKMHRIGVLAITSAADDASARLWDSFLSGLRDLGYIEGKNIVFEWRYSEGRPERFPALATELARSNVDLIVVYTTPAAVAAKAATSTIPILFTVATDPVGAGLAKSLARPGGNITGLSTLSPELAGKRLQHLSEILPHLSQVAVLWNGANPANALALQQTQDAARRLGIGLRTYAVRTPGDFQSRFAAILQRPDALLVLGDALFFERRQEITQFSLQSRLPSSFASKEMAAAGGLMAYGPNYADMLYRAASYADKLLRGAKPSDLPIEQASKFELIVNLKTARQLGIKISESFLLRADQVIE